MKPISMLDILLEAERRVVPSPEDPHPLFLQVEWSPGAVGYQFGFYVPEKDWYSMLWMDDGGEILGQCDRKSRPGVNRFVLAKELVPFGATRVQVLHPSGTQSVSLPV